jgi:hypothetical protein
LEEEVYTKLCIGEGRKIDVWVLMGVRRNNEAAIFPICRKEEDLNHVVG